MSVAFGIDFSTTNSSLAVNDNGEVRLIDVEEYLEGENVNPKLLRSVLYFDDERQVFIGQKAIAQYIGDNTNRRYMQSIKTFLPDLNFNFTSIYDQDYELEELISIILKKMKNRGEELLNQEVSDAVLGRPASFDEDPDIDAFAEERLRSAAGIAGFKNITFQFEPVAAALAFESNLKEGKEKTVLVGDLGGGTSDFTMIKLRGGSHKQRKERRISWPLMGSMSVEIDLIRILCGEKLRNILAGSLK